MKISFSPKQSGDSNFENNIAVPYGAAKRTAPKLRWVIILLVVATPFIFFLGRIFFEWLFVTSPGVVWMEPIIINALEAGTVEKINFKRGDLVNGQDILFTAKRRPPDSRMEALAMLEAEREAGGKLMNTPNRQWGILSYNVAYYAQLRDSVQSLMNKGAATRAELNQAENNLSQAQLALASIIDPLRVEQVEQSIARLKGIAADDFTIASVVTGARASSILVAEGQSFAAGEPLAVLVDPSKVHILTYVDPHDSDKIEFEKTVTVKFIGSGRTVKAIVKHMPVLANDVPNGVSEKLYPVTMRGIQVFLQPIDELQADELIEGLPVVVNW